MPLQNRVTPRGEIVRDPARGLFTGNRGILHDDQRRLGRARWRHPHWIVCRLSFKGRQRQVMAPGRWTELFFLDEAVALAAGHRPCAYCRREAFLSFKEAFGATRAPAVDRELHRHRVDRQRRQVTYPARLDDLPDGAFVVLGGEALLVLGDRLLPWHPSGYRAPRPRRGGSVVEVLAPAPTVAALRNGYRPTLHPTAG